MHFEARCVKLDVCHEVKKGSGMSPKIWPGFTRMIEFLSSEMKVTSGRADFLGKIQLSILVSLTLRYCINIQERLSIR